jgi:outer membrane protein OmpA-like peptidoglycan-associated protein
LGANCSRTVRERANESVSAQERFIGALVRRVRSAGLSEVDTMKKLAAFVPALILVVGCGSRRPEPTTVPPQVVTVAEECAEQWVHMPVLIGFPTGGTQIDEQNRQILQEVVRTASTRDDIRRVRVEGHTDSCGNERDNDSLSLARATSVAEELAAMGVPRELIETEGRGSREPRGEEACDRRTLTQATNRRVEFSILVCEPNQ